jgi:hypothetical protein
LSRRFSRRTVGSRAPAQWKNSRGPSCSWPGSDAKSPKENLTFAVEPRLHIAFIEKQKIMVGLTMVFVEEMVQVTRCFNCNGLGHIARSCKQKPKCHKCGKEGQPKKANPQEGSWQTVSYAAKLKAKIPVKDETTVKMQGKAAEEVKAKLVRKLDIEKIGGPLSQVIPTKRGEVVLVSRNEEQRKKLETVLKATEGIEMGLKKKLNPTVTLTGLETGWKEEEIVEEVF